MPISVKHGGGGIDALAGLLRGQGAYATRESQLRGQDYARIYGQQADARSRASLARISGRTQAGVAAARVSAQRSMHAQSLSAQRSRQVQQIDAQSARDKQAADTAYKRAAVAAGLQSELQEQAFDNRIQAMEEAARQKAKQTKFEYSQNAKREMAKYNAAKEWVANTDTLDAAEKAKANQAIDFGMNNIPLSVRSDDSPDYPEGQGDGQVWVDPETGNTFTRSDGKVTKLHSFRDSKEYLQNEQRRVQQEAEAAKRDKRTERQWKARGDRAAYVLKRTSETLDQGEERVTVEAAGIEWDKANEVFAPGGAFYSPEQDSSVAPQAQQAPQAEAWAEKAEAQGYVVLESDKKYPMQVGIARAAMRTALQKWEGPRESWPKEARETYERARKIVAAFQRSILQLDR